MQILLPVFLFLATVFFSFAAYGYAEASFSSLKPQYKYFSIIFSACNAILYTVCALYFGSNFSLLHGILLLSLLMVVGVVPISRDWPFIYAYLVFGVLFVLSLSANTALIFLSLFNEATHLSQHVLTLLLSLGYLAFLLHSPLIHLPNFKQLIHSRPRGYFLFWYFILFDIASCASLWFLSSFNGIFSAGGQLEFKYHLMLVANLLLIMGSSFFIVYTQCRLGSAHQEMEAIARELEHEQFVHQLSTENLLLGYVANITQNRLLRGFEKISDPKLAAKPYREIVSSLLMQFVHPQDIKLFDAMNELAFYEDKLAFSPFYTMRFRVFPPAFVSQFKFPDRIVQRLLSFKEQWVYVAINCTVVRDQSNGDILLYVDLQDIDAMVRREALEKNGPEKDPLTGLPGINASELRIRREMARTRSGSIFLVDLDNFENVNAQLGHAAGNKIILEIAETLVSEFRESDVVGYCGNASFVVFSSIADVTTLRERALRINGHLCRMIEPKGGGAPVVVSASIGIALYPADGMDYATLFAHAQLALNEAKASGKNCFHFFDSHQIKSAAEKLEENTIIREMLAMLGEETLSRAVDEVLHHLGVTCRSDRAFVFEFGTNEDGKQVLYNTAEWCAENALPMKDKLKGLSVDNWGFFIKPLSEGRMFVCENLESLRESDPISHSILSMQGIERLYVAPIFMHGKLGGFVGVDNPKAGPKSFDLLCNMASFIGREIIRRQSA